MPRLIDADRLSEIIYENVLAPYEDSREAKEECLREIEEAPTVDAVPVVRCKDCKYADKERQNTAEKRYYNEILICRNANLCEDDPLAMWPDDFCSYGERKD